MRRRPQSTKAAPPLAVAAFALVFLLTPTASAQFPDVPGGEDTAAYGFHFRFQEPGFQQVDYLQQVRFPFTVEDFSRDSMSQPGSPAPTDPYSPQPHIIQLTSRIVENNTDGWQAILSNDFFQTFGGMRQEGMLIVSAGPNARPNYITVHVDAVMRLPNGETIQQEDSVRIQLNPYWNGYMQPLKITETTGQFKTLNFPIRVENRATYIDTFILNATAPDGWHVTLPARVVIPAESSAVVNLTVQTPKRGPYVLEEIAAISIQGRSVSDSGVILPTAYVFVTVRGAYLAPQWVPLAALVLVAGLLVVNRRFDDVEERRERRGRPRPVRPTPRQAVLLAELKARDPKAYRERKKQLDAIYKERVAIYRKNRKAERSRERKEAKSARAELKKERAALKKRAKLEAQLEKERAKKERLLRETQRKRRKELEAKKAKLEKARAKEETKLTKVRAKEEKINLKRAKQEEKARLKHEKAARRKGGKKRKK